MQRFPPPVLEERRSEVPAALLVSLGGRTAGDDVVCPVALAGFPVLSTEISEIRRIKPF